MYEFVNRFSHSESEDIIASLDPILGGPGWRNRLDPNLARGAAVERLFRETLKGSGNFKFVISTKIDKATSERPHFFITYGTKSREGLKAFREIEYTALRAHAKSRALAKEKKREEKSSTVDLFAAHNANVQEASIEDIVEEQKRFASEYLLKTISREGKCKFESVVDELLQAFMLRETNVKDICVELAKSGQLKNTWGGGSRKPRDGDLISV